MKNIINFLFLMLLMVIFSGAAFASDALKINVRKYYSAEKNGDWLTVYSLRTDKFRKSVRQSEFVNQMEKSSKGWSGLEFKILNISKKHNTASVLMMFLERPPKKFWVGSGMKANEIRMSGTSIWVKENNSWHCKRTPSRAHLVYTE